MRESMSVRWSSRCSVAWGWEGWQPAKPRIGIGKSLKGRPRIGRLVQPVLQVVSSDLAGQEPQRWRAMRSHSASMAEEGTGGRPARANQ